MMKSTLFGLSIRGKLVTCQYMLSETRSIALVSFANVPGAVADLQRFSRSRLASVRLRSLVLDGTPRTWLGLKAPPHGWHMI